MISLYTPPYTKITPVNENGCQSNKKGPAAYLPVLAVSVASNASSQRRLIRMMLSGADVFVRRLAARHHSGFDPESGQDNSLQ